MIIQENPLAILKKENLSENYTFYTKNEFNEILYNKKTYEIAHMLKYNYENNIDNKEYIEKIKSENLDLSFLKNTLIFMISRGIPQAVLLQKEFNIDISDLKIDIFIKGFINGIKNLEDSELLSDFINLYKNKQELLEEIGKRGNLILLFDLVDFHGLEFSKFNNTNIDKILNKFKINFNRVELFDRINIMGFYNWYDFCLLLFEDYEKAYSFIQETFNFTEEEKDKFENFKESNFYLSYKTEIQKNIIFFENINFDKKNEFTYNDTSEEDNKNNFNKKLTELLSGINFKSIYSIVFLDISGKKEQFNIGNNLELNGYNYNLLEKEDFSYHILENYGEFKLNLDKNNMDFTILIFKENGERDDLPEEEYEENLIAA